MIGEKRSAVPLFGTFVVGIIGVIHLSIRELPNTNVSGAASSPHLMALRPLPSTPSHSSLLNMRSAVTSIPTVSPHSDPRIKPLVSHRLSTFSRATFHSKAKNYLVLERFCPPDTLCAPYHHQSYFRIMDPKKKTYLCGICLRMLLRTP